MRLDTSGLDKIVKNLDKNATKSGRKVAFWIEGRAKSYAPVQTSALRNSIYVNAKGENHYDEAASKVKSLQPGAETEEHPAPTGITMAVVGPCVEYAEYVEFGLKSKSNYQAQPYFTSALMDAEVEFELEATWEDLWEV
jgi:hypothetical protein